MSFRQDAVLTFPEWGNFTLAAKILLSSLGIKYVTYGKATNKHLEVGMKYSPDAICFCFKPTLGGLIESIEKGANVVVWFNSKGKCRARYYLWLQNHILKKLGYEIDFFSITGVDIIAQLQRLSGKSYITVFKSLHGTYKLLKLIERTEKKAYWYRPREFKKGDTEKALLMSLNMIKNIKSFRDLKKIEKEIKRCFSHIKLRKKRVKKLLILGEIYLIHDSYANHSLLRKLGELGFEVIPTQKASDLVKHIIFKNFYQNKKEKITSPFLNVDVGGHARENVMELLVHLKKNDISGVLHVGPFGCMPEVTVNPILQKITQQSNLPYLFITFDVQTSSTGLITRLEAFSDLIQEGF